jgi:hypothetical protein
LASKFLADLYQALSEERLEAYRPPDGSDLEMPTNYFWNIDLIEALVPCMHAVELALRNSLHFALTERYGTEMWFYQPGILDSQGVMNLGRALQYLSRNQPITAGKIVAALNFGFWVSLLAGRYEQTLWQPDGFALQRTVFPNARGVSQEHISRRFDYILGLRNRCFHHEKIWNRPNLAQDHSDIHEAIGWINPTLQIAILSVDNFDTVFASKAQVEADLREQLSAS